MNIFKFNRCTFRILRIVSDAHRLGIKHTVNSFDSVADNHTLLAHIHNFSERDRDNWRYDYVKQEVYEKFTCNRAVCKPKRTEY